MYEDSIFPYRSKEKLEEIAENYIETYKPDLISMPSEIPIDEFIEGYLAIGLKLLPISDDGSILGYMVFKPTQIMIYDDNFNNKQYINIAESSVVVNSELLDDYKNLGRLRFTCAHEAAHWILHRDVFLQDQFKSATFDSEDIFIDEYNDASQDNIANDKRMEWQANYLGAALLMPRRTFIREFLNMLKFLDINNKKYLYRDLQPCNINNYKCMISKLTKVFNVSKEAARIRLIQLNLLKEDERVRY